MRGDTSALEHDPSATLGKPPREQSRWLAALLLSVRANMLAFLASATSITGVILTVGFSLFPFIMPSSTRPQAGLTVWDGSSSHLTLWIMVIAVAVFLPIVTVYTAWVYRVMRGKVTEESVGGTPNSY